MSAPRLEVRLDRLQHNARQLVDRLAPKGIAVTGVTKATLGSPEVAAALLAGGVAAIGESRVENLERLAEAGIDAPTVLIRSPMPSQVERVVAVADVSLNTELAVIALLSAAAVRQGRVHDVVLMVELGDLREGIMPADLDAIVVRSLRFPGIRVRGIGANLGCQNGVTPDRRNMAELSALADSLELRFGLTLDQVSGGNSANLGWALGSATAGRVDDLRLGESILLGREPLGRTAIDGLHTDCFTLVAEVIEAKVKPTRPWGEIQQTAFGAAEPRRDLGSTGRVIVALGRQDIDPDGLEPPPGYGIIGASSDHLVLDAGTVLPAVGTELRFQLGYGALVRAMTSPFVAKVFSGAVPTSARGSDALTALAGG